jgi:hypothetical protein
MCLALTRPAAAQDYHFAHYDSPRGATALASVRVPLGHRVRAKPSYGLSFGIGRPVGAGYDGHTVTRQLQLAEIRFSGRGNLSRAGLIGFDLAHLDAQKRLNLTGGGKGIWVLAGVVAAGVAACLAFECFGNDDHAVPN